MKRVIRKGNGFSLALNTGKGTHLTLIYFNRCKRGYEQDLIRQMAINYFLNENLVSVKLELGDIIDKRRVLITSPLIQKIIDDFQVLFSSFDIDLTQEAHIDLRGHSLDDLDKTISFLDNFTFS